MSQGESDDEQFRLALFCADDADKANALTGHPTEVMGQTECPPLTYRRNLPVGGRLASELQPAFEQHT